MGQDNQSFALMATVQGLAFGLVVALSLETLLLTPRGRSIDYWLAQPLSAETLFLAPAAALCLAALLVLLALTLPLALLVDALMASVFFSGLCFAVGALVVALLVSLRRTPVHLLLDGFLSLSVVFALSRLAWIPFVPREQYFFPMLLALTGALVLVLVAGWLRLRWAGNEQPRADRLLSLLFWPATLLLVGAVWWRTDLVARFAEPERVVAIGAHGDQDTLGIVAHPRIFLQQGVPSLLLYHGDRTRPAPLPCPGSTKATPDFLLFKKQPTFPIGLRFIRGDTQERAEISTAPDPTDRRVRQPSLRREASAQPRPARPSHANPSQLQRVVHLTQR